MSHYLVTGGAGFIGSQIASRLLARGDRVTILDNFSTGRRDNVPKDAMLWEADVCDPSALEKLDGQGVQAVLHLAGQSSGEASHADPIADFDINARGTFLMLQWCRRRGVRRFVYASSMAVYGAATGVVTEDVPTRPVSFYGGSKAAAEIAVSLFGRQGGEPTILRMFNVYGPCQDLRNLRQGMASIYLAYLMRGVPILVKGALERYRDLVFIDDVADGWIAVLDSPAAVGGTYNLGSGTRTTVRSLLDALLDAAGELRSYPIDNVAGTPGDVFGNVADVSRLRDDVGWRPTVRLEEGLRQMVAWARQTDTT